MAVAMSYCCKPSPFLGRYPTHFHLVTLSFSLTLSISIFEVGQFELSFGLITDPTLPFPFWEFCRSLWYPFVVGEIKTWTSSYCSSGTQNQCTILAGKQVAGAKTNRNKSFTGRFHFDRFRPGGIISSHVYYNLFHLFFTLTVK